MVIGRAVAGSAVNVGGTARLALATIVVSRPALAVVVAAATAKGLRASAPAAELTAVEIVDGTAALAGAVAVVEVLSSWPMLASRVARRSNSVSSQRELAPVTGRTRAGWAG